MEDVDCLTNLNADKINTIFKNRGYSKLAAQSKLEEKSSFIKMLGPHTFSFEMHRFIHTSYSHNIPTINITDLFNDDGFPKKETLFLSVLLHHKYFESTARDFFDLFFIINREGELNWQFIYKICKDENLTNQLVIMKKTYYKLLKICWPSARTYQINIINKLKIFLLYHLRIKLALWLPKKRSWITKIMDIIAMFLVYDSFSKSLQCFINKYLKYVNFRKYIQALR